MTENQIRDAYCRIRQIDHTIPDEVLDFMLEASIQAVRAELMRAAADRIAASMNGMVMDHLHSMMRGKPDGFSPFNKNLTLDKIEQLEHDLLSPVYIQIEKDVLAAEERTGLQQEIYIAAPSISNMDSTKIDYTLVPIPNKPALARCKKHKWEITGNCPACGLPMCKKCQSFSSRVGFSDPVCMACQAKSRGGAARVAP
jgi:hypothetical protein